MACHVYRRYDLFYRRDQSIGPVIVFQEVLYLFMNICLSMAIQYKRIFFSNACFIQGSLESFQPVTANRQAFGNGNKGRSAATLFQQQGSCIETAFKIICGDPGGMNGFLLTVEKYHRYVLIL